MRAHVDTAGSNWMPVEGMGHTNRSFPGAVAESPPTIRSCSTGSGGTHAKPEAAHGDPKASAVTASLIGTLVIWASKPAIKFVKR